MRDNRRTAQSSMSAASQIGDAILEKRITDRAVRVYGGCRGVPQQLWELCPIQNRCIHTSAAFKPCIVSDGSLDDVTAYNATIRIVNDTTFDADEVAWVCLDGCTLRLERPGVCG